jgi:hypothetical protein
MSKIFAKIGQPGPSGGSFGRVGEDNSVSMVTNSTKLVSTVEELFDP